MTCYICDGNVFLNGSFQKKSLFIKDGIIADIFTGLPAEKGVLTFYMNNCFVFPGLIDVHVHLREPGFFYKESIKSGTLAAAHGGFTAVCAMPNLNPVPDSMEHLKQQTDIIDRDARVRVYPYGSITQGQRQERLSDMDALAESVIAFSDDGMGVESEELMESAMIKAKALGKMIVAHCEDSSLVNGAFIHDGAFAAENGFKGNPSESEWRQLERDLRLVEKTGCDYHVCHVSCKESVELIRRAKAKGLPVTCETAPHYLLLSDENLLDEGRFRMNPPIRSAGDRAALIEAIKDGTVDIIATDHAPHSSEEKSGGLAESLNGIVGLETAFPVLYTGLVEKGVITLERLLELMQLKPGERFGIGSRIEVGARADITAFNLEEEYTIEPERFYSKGHASPFAGDRVRGKCIMTLVGGSPAYLDRAFCFNDEVKDGE